MTRPRSDRELDVVVFGATGFVGRLVAQYLAEHAPEGARVGLGGRSRARLEAVRDRLGGAAARWPLLVVDATDPAALAGMVERARAVATTVGPYARYGLPLVEACARTGTDYADLTGEVLFVRQCIDRYQDLAVTSGARIVHSCGFDSVPSDLGVLLTHQRSVADGNGELTDTMLVATARGGFSGGTIDSLRAQVDAVRAEPRLRRLLADPYALSPDRAAEPDLGPQVDAVPPHREPGLAGWVGSFVMAPYNARVVRRSNALQGWAYGRRFRYREVMSYGAGPAAPVVAALAPAVLRAGAAALAFGPTRAVLDRLLPSPGSGPGERTRRSGFFKMDIRTRTSAGAGYRCVVAGQGDPGYTATSVMLGESALCLALWRDRLPDRAGVLTPATALGAPLADRLRAAGMRLEVDRR